MRKIEMVDLRGQYLHIKKDIDEAIQAVLDSAVFVKGGAVPVFQHHLEEFLGVRNVITVGNGTDALLVSLMALDLRPGDEVIVPSFSFIAAAEVVSFLGLKLVLADVDPQTFNLTAETVRKVLTSKTRAIVPVHLFGQNVEMEEIMNLARERNLYVVEDACQSIASKCHVAGEWKYSGTVGNVGCTSFFPSKNLGCYGDGGAVYTNDDALAERIRSISNHGMVVRYHNDRVGVNSRLDSLQAAVLDVKLRHLEEYCDARRRAAHFYSERLSGVGGLVLPTCSDHSTHVWHQYTVRVKQGRRDALQAYLKELDVPSMIYYPIPIHHQKAYQDGASSAQLPISEMLCGEVLSLPMHTELDDEQLSYITDSILEFFKK